MSGVERAWTRFVTPPRRPVSAEERRVLAAGERFTVLDPSPHEDERAGELACRRWGDGPVVVALHGWGGSAGQLGAIVEALVRRGCRCVAFDAPAHGASPGERTTVFEFASALRRVVEAACPGAAPLALVGHSLGALAVSMACEEGLEVERVALAAPTPSIEHEVARFARAARLAPAAVTELRAWMERRFEGLWRRTSLAGNLARNTAGGLVVHDELDRDAPFDEVARATRGATAFELHASRGLGHVALLRDRAVVDRIAAHVVSGAAAR